MEDRNILPLAGCFPRPEKEERERDGGRGCTAMKMGVSHLSKGWSPITNKQRYNGQRVNAFCITHTSGMRRIQCQFKYVNPKDNSCCC